MKAGLSWRYAEVDEVCAAVPLENWADPTGDRPVWSGRDFRRAAVMSAPQRAAYLLAHREGRPVLAAPLIIADEPGGLLFYDIPAMIGDDRAFGTSAGTAAGAAAGVVPDAARARAYPSLAVATPGGYHGILVEPALDAGGRAAVCAALPAALAALAGSLGCRSYGVLYATGALVRWLAARDPWQVAVLGAEAVLELAGRTWEHYLRQLSSRRRIRVARERRAFLDGGVRTEIAGGPGALGEDLVGLRANLRERHGLPGHREQTRAEFAALARWCGERLVVIRARIGDDVVGFTIFLRDGARLYARTAGFDYERLGTADFVYFNVTYYAAVEWAGAHGVRRLEYGLASYPAKRTRGCWFLPRFGVLHLPDAGGLREVLGAQSDAEQKRLAAECGAALALPRGLADG